MEPRSSSMLENRNGHTKQLASVKNSGFKMNDRLRWLTSFDSKNCDGHKRQLVKPRRSSGLKRNNRPRQLASFNSKNSSELKRNAVLTKLVLQNLKNTVLLRRNVGLKKRLLLRRTLGC